MGKLLDTLKSKGIEITEDIEKEVMTEFVEKKDVDLKDTEISTLKEQIKTRDQDIEELKKVDGAKLQEELTTLQGKYKEDTDKLQKQLEDTVFENALDLELTGINAKDVKLVKTLLDREKIKLNDGKVEGFKEQIEQIKKEKEFLFNAETSETKKPPYEYKPNGGTGSDENLNLSDAVAMAMEIK